MTQLYTPLHMCKDSASYRTGICSAVFTAALVTRARKRKQPKCPLTDKWIMKRQYLCPMEYNSDVEKNEIMTFAGKQMGLEEIIMNEVTQAQEDKHPVFPLIC